MTKEISYNFSPIGIVHSCYKEKFGIPRQPLLVSSPATIEIMPAYSNDDAFRELENFSHIWVIFVFHKTANQDWHPTVRPPRLGGNKRTGVFASRSMFRPNPVGLSVVELTSIERQGSHVVLNIRGGDFLEGTPVLDIKPYLPYADAIENANAAYAELKPPARFKVTFSTQARAEIARQETNYPGLGQLVTEILQLDPRPAYQDKQQLKTDYAMKLYDFDLKWKVENEEVLVVALTPLSLAQDSN